MYDHIGLVQDIDATVRFYAAALGAFGHELASRDESGAGLGPHGAPAGSTQRPANRRSACMSHCGRPAARRSSGFMRKD